MYDDLWYSKECSRIEVEHRDEIRRLLQWDRCELERDFLGFLQGYADLNIPDDFVIFDFGCYMGVQAQYFSEHAAYVGIDPAVPGKWRFQQFNMAAYEMTAQEFIRNVLPEFGYDLKRCFAICSYVPDKEVQHLVAETFPYHKIVYCDAIISQKLPDDLFLDEYSH